MKQRSLLILLVAAVLMNSCSNKGGKSGLMVPKDAAVVVHINSASLSSKISWNEIKQTNWFKEMRTNSDANDSLTQRIFDDPANSGIDTKEDFVMFIKKHGAGSYMVFEGSLTSQATYEQVLADLHKKQPAEIKKAGDFSYMVPKDKTVVLWNKTKFALVSNANMPAKMPGGMGGMMRRENMSEEVHEFDADSLRIFGQQALTLEGSNNLDADSRFADLVKNGSDVHVWFNTGEYYSGMNMLKKMAPMVNMDAVFKDNIAAMSLNFDNGKITAKSKHYYGDELSKIISNNRPKAISADVINRIPSSDVVAVFALNYSPTGLKELMKVIGIDAMADAYLSRMNYSIDDFVKANNGEVLVAITDPKFKMDSAKVGNQVVTHPGRPDANILFATSVKDKAAFEKMLTLIWDFTKQMSGRTDKSEAGPPPIIPGINYKLENNWFAVSNSQEFTDKFLAGGNSNLPFVSRISGHPMGVYIDLQRIIRLAGSMAKDSSDGKAMFDASIAMWQDVLATGGDYKDKSSEGQFEINLVDKNTNSLKQLNQYFDKIASFMKMKKEHRDNAMHDSGPLMVPPPAEHK